MVKERTDGAPQLNLRVPLAHHDRVRKVVALLRSVEGFPGRLDELIATASEPLTPSFQADVMTRIKHLEAVVFTQAKPVKPVVASTARKAIKPTAVSDSGDSGGSKRGVSLPAYVSDKVRDLIETKPEMSNGEIAKAVGISPETVRRIRRGRR
jgi:hypothetical protein